MERRWLYFGCYQQGGHFLWDARGNRLSAQHPFCRFDGTLCLPEAVGERVAAISRLGFCGYSALAFWDRSIDTRSGSNSIVFAPSLDCSAEAIVAGARRFLPLYAARWPDIDISRAEYRPQLERLNT